MLNSSKCHCIWEEATVFYKEHDFIFENGESEVENHADYMGNILRVLRCEPHSIPTQKELGRGDTHVSHVQTYTYPGQKAGKNSIRILTIVLSE